MPGTKKSLTSRAGGIYKKVFQGSKKIIAYRSHDVFPTWYQSSSGFFKKNMYLDE
jgi:hypothetical protein